MFFTARAALGLAAIAFFPFTIAKPYPSPIPTSTPGAREVLNVTHIELAKRDCASDGGTVCGWHGTLCCSSGQTCGENSANQAICLDGAGGATAGGSWVTATSVYSFYVSATAAAQPTGCTGVQSPCHTICCDSGYYCLTSGTCAPFGGSSGGIIATGTPTATVPFEPPLSTGATGVPIAQTGGGGGLSSGAIAGIVIGVLLGLFLLFLLCLFCCFRALFDTIMACFGRGRRQHTHEETYIEQHHHSSGGAAAAGGRRRWYGQGPARPARSKKSSGGFGNALGIGALLGGAALALGLKRKHDRRHDDKSTTVSGSSAYYSEDYTSSSSASSSDRHTRHTRQSSRPGR